MQLFKMSLLLKMSFMNGGVVVQIKENSISLVRNDKNNYDVYFNGDDYLGEFKFVGYDIITNITTNLPCIWTESENSVPIQFENFAHFIHHINYLYLTEYPFHSKLKNRNDIKL